MLSWVSEEDLTKDGGVLKKILQEADSKHWEKPKDDSTVTINYIAKLDDGTLVEEKNEFQFILGAEEVILGLEKLVESMKKGEKSWAKIAPTYAYGVTGCEEKNVPPNATLVYEVQLTNFTKVSAETAFFCSILLGFITPEISWCFNKYRKRHHGK